MYSPQLALVREVTIFSLSVAMLMMIIMAAPSSGLAVTAFGLALATLTYLNVRVRRFVRPWGGDVLEREIAGDA